MNTTFELAQYHAHNPDPDFGMCRNTGEEPTDGVVFPGVEPMEGAYCFIGRQSILEAIGALYGITVDEAKARMEVPFDLIESAVSERAQVKPAKRKPNPDAPIR